MNDNLEEAFKDTAQIKEVKVIEENKEADGMHRLWYFRSKSPMMSERDMVGVSIIKPMGEGKELYITSSATHPDYPVKKGTIRISMYDATLAEQVGDDLKMTKYSNFDLGGYIPIRLLNMIIANSSEKQNKQMYEKLQSYA